MRGSGKGQDNATDPFIGNSPCNGTKVDPLSLPNYSFSSCPFRRLRTTSTCGEIELGGPVTLRLTDFLGFLASRLETSFLAMAHFL